MPENLTPFQKCDTIDNLLDKLVDAKGRAKCGYIYIIGEFVDQLRDDIAKLQNGTKSEEVSENGG